MLLTYLKADECDIGKCLEERISNFCFIILLSWFWTMVFLVHCYVTFRVYIFTSSDRLSSRLLRRNHIFYFLFCYWALSAVLFMSWHTRIQGNVPSPQNAHVRRRPGERPHSAVLGHMASLVGKAFCRHFEDRGFLVSQLAWRPAQSGSHINGT